MLSEGGPDLGSGPEVAESAALESMVCSLPATATRSLKGMAQPPARFPYALIVIVALMMWIFVEWPAPAVRVAALIGALIAGGAALLQVRPTSRPSDDDFVDPWESTEADEPARDDSDG